MESPGYSAPKAALQLYSAETPNGLKIMAALEEIKEIKKGKGENFQFESHVVDIRHGESRTQRFMTINKNGKIPILVDEELVLAESGAILIYLAEKNHELLPEGPARYDTIQWLLWSSTSVSIQIKQFIYFYKYCHNKLPFIVERNAKEVKRLLSTLELQLERRWICGNVFTLADIATWPWVHRLTFDCDDAFNLVFDNFKDFPKVRAWLASCLARPASIKAMDANKLIGNVNDCIPDATFDSLIRTREVFKNSEAKKTDKLPLTAPTKATTAKTATPDGSSSQDADFESTLIEWLPIVGGASLVAIGFFVFIRSRKWWMMMLTY